MSSEWNEYRLSDVIEIIGGGTPKRSEPSYWDGNIPWLSVADFNNDLKFVVHTAEKITEAGLNNSSTKLLEVGDVIISARGTVGCLAQLSKPMAFNQSCYGLRAKTNYLTNDYLYYLLRIKVAELKQYVHGAVFDTITRSTFDDITVRLPLLETQTVIVNMLGALDDKIHLNHQVNQTLEQMAQAIFKSWFVDFEPVKAKITALEAGGNEEDANLAAMQAISGKTLDELKQLIVKNSDHYQQLYTIAQHFPAAMQNSELGEIPEGWGVSNLGDTCVSTDYVANGSFQALKENVELYDEVGDVIYVRTTDFNKGFLSDLKYTSVSAYSFLAKSKLFGREVIISNVGDVGTVFRAPVWLGKLMTLGANAVALISDEFGGYLFCFFRSDIGQHLIRSITTGSAQLKFNKTNLRSLKILIPDTKLIGVFEEIEKSLHRLYITNMKKSMQLTQLRDELLPRLLSGELSVENLG